jgi:outer membrane protein assembly factor BamB
VSIAVVCPRCKRTFHLQPELQGQAIRCPGCGYIFLVEQAEPPRTPAAGRPGPTSTQHTGSVGDLIPILPAEAAPLPNPAQPPSLSSHVSDLLPLVESEPANPENVPLERTPSWHEPPPVRRPGDSTPPAFPDAPPVRRKPGDSGSGIRPPVPRSRPPADVSPPAPTPPRRAIKPPPAAEPPASDFTPQVFGPGDWSTAPPVRRGEDAEASAETEPAAAEVPQHRARIRGGWKGIMVIALLSGGVIGGGGALAYYLMREGEAEQAARADSFYESKQFGAAANLYEQLATHYPTSENTPRYRFRAEISELRGGIADNPEDTNALLERIEGFVGEHQKDPLLRSHAPDLGESLVQLVEHLGQRVAADPKSEARKTIARARKTSKVLQDIKKGKALTREQLAQLDKAFADMIEKIEQMETRAHWVATIKDEARKYPPFKAIQIVKDLAHQADAEVPGFSASPEVTGLITSLYDRHLGSVKYLPGPDPKAPRDRAEESEPGILFGPLEGAPPAGREDPVKLALVRGVLYWLKQSDGEVKWAVRVGADTTALPLRVPASAGSSERILVLSADDTASHLTAYDTDANVLWRYRLTKPCLGQPVLVGPRAYLATTDGQVHEIELAAGKVLGRYQLDQPLLLGGVREPNSNRVYFPADDSCIYVLDVQKRRCLNILYSGHPAGSLRSVPLVVPSQGTTPGYLVLEQARGLHAVELRVFDLPITDRHAAARRLSPRPQLDGWTWFACAQDPEKVVLLSDTGALGLFGIRQARNNDQALFPLLAGGALRLNGLLGRGSERFRDRSEVVQVQGDDLWLQAAGRLQRLRLAWDQKLGPQLVPGWDKPLALGAPLHASQVGDDPFTGRSTLYLVTQPERRQVCWATAIDDEEGTVRWQRQLGLVCQGAPLLLPAPAGGERVVLLQDQGGALFALDPKRVPHRPHVRWRVAGAEIRLADALDDNPAQPPLLLPAPDGKSAYQIASPGTGTQLVVRHVHFGGPRQLRAEQESVKLPAPLGGPPAVVGTWLLLPLADGTLARLPLPLPAGLASVEVGPDWRDARADANARGYVLALGDERFLTTNGALGLIVWDWPARAMATWEALPRDQDPPTWKLADRVVAAPLRLPGPPGTPVRVCVADSAGKLIMLELQLNGALKEVRTWDLGGTANAAPFALVLPGGRLRVGCIVAGNRLVWIDPERKGLRWQFRTTEPIIDRPRLAEGLLVLADRSGRYVGIDPESGKAAGPGTQLRGSVAPAACPVPFGSGRLLAPLSDGTALLLSRDRIDHPLRKFPAVW